MAADHFELRHSDGDLAHGRGTRGGRQLRRCAACVPPFAAAVAADRCRHVRPDVLRRGMDRYGGARQRHRRKVFHDGARARAAVRLGDVRLSRLPAGAAAHDRHERFTADGAGLQIHLRLPNHH